MNQKIVSSVVAGSAILSMFEIFEDNSSQLQNSQAQILDKYAACNNTMDTYSSFAQLNLADLEFDSNRMLIFNDEVSRLKSRSEETVALAEVTQGNYNSLSNQINESLSVLARLEITYAEISQKNQELAAMCEQLHINGTKANTLLQQNAISMFEQFDKVISQFISTTASELELAKEYSPMVQLCVLEKLNSRSEEQLEVVELLAKQIGSTGMIDQQRFDESIAKIRAGYEELKKQNVDIIISRVKTSKIEMCRLLAGCSLSDDGALFYYHKTLILALVDSIEVNPEASPKDIEEFQNTIVNFKNELVNISYYDKNKFTKFSNSYINFINKIISKTLALVTVGGVNMLSLANNMKGDTRIVDIEAVRQKAFESCMKDLEKDIENDLINEGFCLDPLDFTPPPNYEIPPKASIGATPKTPPSRTCASQLAKRLSEKAHKCCSKIGSGNIPGCVSPNDQQLTDQITGKDKFDKTHDSNDQGKTPSGKKDPREAADCPDGSDTCKAN